MRLPVIVECNAWTLPQERYNAEWIRQQGVGIVLGNFREIGRAVGQMLEPAAYANFRAATERIDNRAVFEIPDILERILSRSCVNCSPAKGVTNSTHCPDCERFGEDEYTLTTFIEWQPRCLSEGQLKWREPVALAEFERTKPVPPVFDFTDEHNGRAPESELLARRVEDRNLARVLARGEFGQRDTELYREGLGFWIETLGDLQRRGLEGLDLAFMKLTVATTG